MPNFTKSMITSLQEAGFATLGGFGQQRRVFTNVRKGGQRVVKLWVADDVFGATRRKQLKLERALKKNYPGYIGGYFGGGPYQLPGSKSLVIVFKEST